MGISFFCNLFVFRVTYVINDDAILLKDIRKSPGEFQEKDAEGESLNKCSEFYVVVLLIFECDDSSDS